MKPLLILMRIVLVGIFWSIFFLEGIRVIMLTNWWFDIFRPAHWEHAWNLWLSGWVINDLKEWAFVLIILTFIPLWLTGWAAISMIRWGHLFMRIVYFPLIFINRIFGDPLKKIANTASVKVVKKKKSYKEIRPRSIRSPIEDSSLSTGSSQKMSSSKGNSQQMRNNRPSPSMSTPQAEKAPTKFEHSLFQFDETEDFDFNFDDFDDKKKPEEAKIEEGTPIIQAAPEPTNQKGKGNNQKDNNKNKNRNNNNNQRNNTPPQVAPTNAPSPDNAPRSGSIMDIIKQKGYEVINGATIKNTLIDFIGVADKQICICLSDKEPGDWLADEERFNDEEPLWFSESSHRISPVRKADVARLILTEKLADAELDFKISTFVVEQIGNIINAEDMFEIWTGMDINVTRIDRGTPKELRLFAKTLEDADKGIEKDKFEKVKKLIRSIA